MGEKPTFVSSLLATSSLSQRISPTRGKTSMQNMFPPPGVEDVSSAPEWDMGPRELTLEWTGGFSRVQPQSGRDDSQGEGRVSARRFRNREANS